MTGFDTEQGTSRDVYRALWDLFELDAPGMESIERGIELQKYINPSDGAPSVLWSCPFTSFTDCGFMLTDEALSEEDEEMVKGAAAAHILTEHSIYLLD